MIAITAIGLLSTASGAAGDTAVSPLVPQSHQARESTASPRVAPVTSGVSSHVRRDTQGQGGPSHRAANCPSARKAVKFYAGRIAYWRSKMGAPALDIPPHAGRCPRYLSKVLRAKAHAAHKAFIRWQEYHYAWRSWLPAKWQRIAICETGMNWRHSNSSYEGAFGFAKSSWDSFKYHADRKAGPYPEDAWQATPRQQYEVALAIWRRYGLSGWGCRNA